LLPRSVDLTGLCRQECIYRAERIKSGLDQPPPSESPTREPAVPEKAASEAIESQHMKQMMLQAELMAKVAGFGGQVSTK
jgi:hypothetical protein